MSIIDLGTFSDNIQVQQVGKYSLEDMRRDEAEKAQFLSENDFTIQICHQ
jgi:hypothetical protein